MKKRWKFDGQRKPFFDDRDFERIASEGIPKDRLERIEQAFENVMSNLKTGESRLVAQQKQKTGSQ